MKKRFFFKGLILTLVLSSGHLTSFAQLPIQGNESLDGENIISGADFDFGGEIEATASHLYSRNYTGGNLTTNPVAFDQIWTPPAPRKIAHIGVKVERIFDVKGEYLQTKTTDNLVVLLDNGDVYKLFIGHHDSGPGDPQVGDEAYFNEAYTPGTEGYDKILGDALYVLSSSHLYVSYDSTHWNVDSSGLNGVHINDVSLDTVQRVYAATGNGLFVQDTTPGSKFLPVTSYTGPASVSAVFVDRKNRKFASSNSGGAWSSTDGTSWGIDTAGIGNQYVKSFGDDAFGNVYAVISNTFTGTDHIYKSPGGTNAWQLTDTSIYNKTVNPVGLNSFFGDTLLFATTQYGSFVSLDTGRTWILKNKGIHSENISGIAKTQTGQLLVANTSGINKYDGSTWTKYYPQNGFKNNLPLYDDRLGTFYTIDNSLNAASALGGTLFKSTDAGNTWVADTAGLSNVGGTIFYVDENGGQHIGNTIYGGTHPCKLWVKAKNGAWAIDTSGFPVAPYNFVSSFASDNKGYLYVTGFFSSKLMRRANTGTQWIVDTAGLPASISYFNKLAGAKGDVIGATGNALYHRGAGTWSSIPLPAQAGLVSINAIAIDSSGYVFAALTSFSGTSGVYFTSDLGSSWKYAGLDTMNVESLVSYGDTTYVLTRNLGAFVLTHASALPATLSALKAYQLNKGIQVEWSGFNEVNMAGYDVEKSAGGVQFSKVANVTATGNSVGENKYSLFDASPFIGDNFYRIKAISKDGRVQYSGVVKVNISDTRSGMMVFPNPATNKTINVQLNNINAGNYSLIVYNAAGQKLYARTVKYAGGSASISIDGRNFAKGVYWVILKGARNTFSKTIAVQ